MDTSTLLIGHIKTNIANKLNVSFNQVKHNFSNLNQFQCGVLTVLSSIITLQLVYTCCMMNGSFLFVVVDLVKILLTIVGIFSIFTWLHVIYGRKWSDTSIFILFISCFMSEFMIQLLIVNDKSIQFDKKTQSNKNPTHQYNTINPTSSSSSISSDTSSSTISSSNTKHASQDWKYLNLIYLSSELAQYIFILFVCTLANSILMNTKLMRSFVFMFFLCVARLSGSIYLFNIIPLSINAYFTYLCALSGVLFSHYIQKIFNEFNSTHISNNNSNKISNNITTTNTTSKPRIEINLNDDMDNFKMTKITTNNNHKYTSNNNNFVKTNNINNNNNNSNNINKTRRKISSIETYKRRTSLPTIPLKFEKINSGTGYLDEVINLIDDILSNRKTLTLESIYDSLETIKQIINNTKCMKSSFVNNNNNNNELISKPFCISPINSKSSKNKFSLTINSMSNNELKHNCFDLKKLHSNSYSADEDDDTNRNTLSVFYNSTTNGSHKTRLRRSLPGRSPSVAWSSTTTSANGMPVVENVPCKQRSSSLKFSGFISHNLFLNANGSSRDLLERQLDKSNTLFDLNESENNMPLKNVQKNQNSDYEDDETTAASSLISNTSNQNNKTSDYESGESPNSSDYNSDNDKLQLKDLQYQYNGLSMSNKKLDEIQEENSNSKLPWQANEISKIDLLDYLHDWNFPIFQLNDRTDNHVLSKMAFKIFDRVGLFKSFDIPIDAFISYFSELEKGYIELPYHNKIHAADVLHACYYLTTQPVPGFSHVDNSNGKERQSLKHFTNSMKYKLNNDSYGSVGANFDPLELLALYCAAAMHDFDHPGRNNQFLVRINSPLALLYNDRSVLENHHAAASWKLFRSNGKFNFLSGLDADELKRFRFLVIENILATDLNKHFLIINEFNNIVKNKNSSFGQYSSNIDWTNESDRLLISKMIIKLADINSPLKEKDLHLQWTERICEEFYQQGEEEERLGIPISSFMDRKNPQVAKLQENFMTGLVGSLSNAYASAGLLPGILIEDPHSTTTETEEFSDSDLDLSHNSNLKNNKSQNTNKIFYSELTSNFKTNYEMWCEFLKLQDQKK